MNKITADHLSRRACVYIRQSTPDQVQHNLESQRRQYGLARRRIAGGELRLGTVATYMPTLYRYQNTIASILQHIT